MATYNLTQTTPTELKTGDIINVPYSGTYKTITLPKGIYKLEVWGAQGGSYSSYYGGCGGYSYGTLTLIEETTVLYCYAGGQPATNSSNRVTTSGGFNGGGTGYNRYYSGTYTYGQGGGGGSDIRINSTSLYARVIVAGGGGGSASVNAQTTKYGGGTSGGSPQSGYGASQTAAGTNGSFGNGGNATTNGSNYKYGSGGGGGGWYGGGACSNYSDSTNYRGYNGGGSGYVYTSSTASNYPSGCLLNSAYYLTDATTVAGNTAFVDPDSGSSVTGRSGNGYVRITVIEIKEPLRVNVEEKLTVLPYIESTGTQYIDTGVNGKSGLVVKAKYLMSDESMASGHFLSSCSRGYSNRCYLMSVTNSKYTYGYISEVITNFSVSANTEYEIEVNTNVGTQTTLLNGAVAMTNIDSSVYDNNTPLTIFALNNGGSITEFSSGRIYWLQIYNDNTLVRDFIPVLDENNVACLYDTVEKKLYYNQGTGVFYYLKPVELPEGYIQLNYIESSGTQYIDTGFKPNQDTRVVMDAQPTSTMSPDDSTIASLFGARISATSNNYAAHIYNGKIRTDYNNVYSLTFSANPLSKLFIDKNKETTTVNGESNSYTSATFQTPVNLVLFALNNNGTIQWNCSAKLYSCQIYDNGTLIRNFIPCTNTSGTAGLYDLVEGKFYTNSGTGTFANGETVDFIKTEFINHSEWKKSEEIYVKNGVKLTRLDYIESTGTQYIDTGVKPTSNISVELDFQLNMTTGWACVFGGRDNDSNKNTVALWLNDTGQLCFYRDGNYSAFPSNVSASTRHYFKSIGNVANIDGNTVSVADSTFTGANNIYLFASNNAGTIARYSNCKIYYCKIYDNDILIRDYIPVLDENNVACLYDKITKQLFYNKGTGVFDYLRRTELPEGYVQTKYIQSSGTQYIDTGFKPNQDTRVVMDCDIIEGELPTPFGSFVTNDDPYFIVLKASNGTRYYYGTSYTVTSQSILGRHLINANKNKLYLDGNLIVSGSKTTFSCDKTMLLCGRSDGSEPFKNPTSMKIYSCQIYDSITMVHNYIPCKNASGTVGLYDLIENKFYTNAGTGTFTYGEITDNFEDILPSERVLTHTEWVKPKEVYVKSTDNLTVLDYIESTGTQYIDTLYKPNQDTRVVAEMAYTTHTDATCGLFGSTTSPNVFEVYNYKTKWYFSYANLQPTKNASPVTGTKLYIDVSKTSGKVKVNDIEYNITPASSSAFAITDTLTIHALHRNGSMSYHSNSRVYAFKIYDNNILVRDYIPVLDNNGTPCLYDKVHGVFYYNQGTGEFIAGYKTEFEPETELAFLESTGTQYIDTKFIPNQDTRVVMDIECVATSDTSTSTYLCGARSGSASNQFALQTLSNHYAARYGTQEVTVKEGSITGRYIIDMNKNLFTVDNLSITVNAETFNCHCEFHIFALNNNGTGGYCPPANMKLYSCQIYDNGTLIRDYIPKTDLIGTPALFDKVSQTYYYNAGTGTFKTGTILKRAYWKQVI